MTNSSNTKRKLSDEQESNRKKAKSDKFLDALLYFRLKENIINLIDDYDADARNEDGDTALHLAVYKGDLEILDLLLKKGGAEHISAQANGGYTALHLAARKGDIKIVELLLNAGGAAHISAQDDDGNTALHYALMKMQRHSTKREDAQALEALALKLVAEGADINLPNNLNQTPFSIGAIGQFSEEFILATLTNPSLDIHATNELNQTPLHLAIESTSYDSKLLEKYNCNIIEIVTQLIQKGANVEARDQDGLTPLFAAVWSGERGLVKLLIEGGANINVQNEDEESLLFSPEVRHFSTELLDMLMNNSEILDMPSIHSFQGKEGVTLLHKSVKQRDISMIEALLKHGANINVVDNDGDTALHYAISEGFQDIIQLLVERGADINVANNAGTTILTLAQDNGVDDFVNDISQNFNHNTTEQNEVPILGQDIVSEEA